jgi:hypothetical protein
MEGCRPAGWCHRPALVQPEQDRLVPAEISAHPGPTGTPSAAQGAVDPLSAGRVGRPAAPVRPEHSGPRRHHPDRHVAQARAVCPCTELSEGQQRPRPTPRLIALGAEACQFVSRPRSVSCDTTHRSPIVTAAALRRCGAAAYPAEVLRCTSNRALEAPGRSLLFESLSHHLHLDKDRSRRYPGRGQERCQHVWGHRCWAAGAPLDRWLCGYLLAGRYASLRAKRSTCKLSTSVVAHHAPLETAPVSR